MVRQEDEDIHDFGLEVARFLAVGDRSFRWTNQPVAYPELLSGQVFRRSRRHDSAIIQASDQNHNLFLRRSEGRLMPHVPMMSLELLRKEWSRQAPVIPEEGIMYKCLFRFAVLLAITMFFTSTVSAAEKPSFGFLGGLDLANLTVDPDPADASLDFIRQANVGGLVEFGLTPVASLQARCMYVPKGTGLDAVEDGISLSAKTVIDYVTVPVLLKFQADTVKVRPYVVVGPEFGFKARATVSLSTSASVPRDLLAEVEDELNDQVNNELKSTDVALDFGGGVEIPSGRMTILIEGIYSLGLRNIAVNSEGEEGSAKTRTFLFDVGIRF